MAGLFDLTVQNPREREEALKGARQALNEKTALFMDYNGTLVEYRPLRPQELQHYLDEQVFSLLSKKLRLPKTFSSYEKHIFASKILDFSTPTKQQITYARQLVEPVLEQLIYDAEREVPRKGIPSFLSFYHQKMTAGSYILSDQEVSFIKKGLNGLTRFFQHIFGSDYAYEAVDHTERKKVLAACYDSGIDPRQAIFIDDNKFVAEHAAKHQDITTIIPPHPSVDPSFSYQSLLPQ